MLQVCLGFRVHSGWAIVIAFGGNEVVERRRLRLVGEGLPVQPYHAAKSLSFSEAERLIQRCKETSRHLAIQELVRPSAYKVRAACILASSGRPLPDLVSILASHALIHTAEGEMYRESLRQAAAHCHVPLASAREKDVLAQLPAELRQQIEGYGKKLGPPWRQDEKLATAAAYVAQIAGLGDS